MRFNETGNDTEGISDILYLEKLNEEKLRTQLPAIIYTAILMIVGTPGNSIVIYIYFFKWRRSTSRMFILYLALLDLVNCMTTLPMEIYIMRYSLMLDIPFVCKLSRFSTYTMNSSSALILIGIAVDRFKRICKPYQRTFSESNSKSICIGAILISLNLTWPAIVLYGTREVRLGDVKGYSCLIENKYDLTPFPIIFFGVMGFMTLVIFTTLSTLYYFVGKVIYKHRMFKLKNCSHVEKVVDEKSTDKSKNAKLSNDIVSKISKENENKDAAANGIVITLEKPSDSNHLQTEQKQSNNDQELGTSYNFLRIPVNTLNEESCDRSSGEFSTKHIDLESHSQVGHENKDNTNASEAVIVPLDDNSPVRKVKKRRTRVRYVLVRGSSTLNSSGRTKCIDCLTVRIGKSTFMLFLITIVYIISFLPFYILAIIRQSKTLFVEQLSPAGSVAYHVLLRSYLLSSAINPLIYSFCNAQFRGYCVDILKRIFLRKSDVRNSRFQREY